MKKIFIALGLATMLAAGCQPANQAATQKTVTYTNTENGYTMQIPEDWVIVDNKDASNTLLSFKTRDKHTVRLQRDNFGPMELPPVPEGVKPADVGTEAGYIETGYHCGDGTPNGGLCTGTLIFQSPQMSRKGFALEFHIEQVEESARKADDPYTDFQEDVKDIQAVLKTFALTTK